MNNINGAVKDKVSETIVEATAIQIAPKLVKASETIMAEEIQANHLRQMGILVIDTETDADKDVYSGQLDEVQHAVGIATGLLREAQGKLAATVASFRKKLIHTELRRSAAESLKSANKIKHLSSKYTIDPEDDNVFTVDFRDGDADSEDTCKRVPHMAWSYELKMSARRYSSSYSQTIPCSGVRALNKECKDSLVEVAQCEKEIVNLMALNKSIRDAIQALEIDRRIKRRSLDEAIIKGSVVGSQLQAQFRSKRKRIKALPLPTKYRK